jgi:hypothetical protein
MTAWIPPGYTPREYISALLTVAFPEAYAFEGTEDEDVEAYLAEPEGVAQLQRYVADAPDARIPVWMRPDLRRRRRRSTRRMTLTFRTSIRVLPGVRLNLGRRSWSVTVGARRGPRWTWSSTGRRTTSMDLPGPFGWRSTTRRGR